jgi:hypothetical protein
MPAQNVLLTKCGRLDTGIWRWCLRPCIRTVYRRISLEFSFIIYNCHKTGKIANSLDFYIELQDVHQPQFWQFFCKINTFPLLDKLPHKIIPCFIISENEGNKCVWDCWYYWYVPLTCLPLLGYVTVCYDIISSLQWAKTCEILGSHSGIGEDSSLQEYDAASQDAASYKTHPIISRC